MPSYFSLSVYCQPSWQNKPHILFHPSLSPLKPSNHSGLAYAPATAPTKAHWWRPNCPIHSGPSSSCPIWPLLFVCDSWPSFPSRTFLLLYLPWQITASLSLFWGLSVTPDTCTSGPYPQPFLLLYIYCHQAIQTPYSDDSQISNFNPDFSNQAAGWYFNWFIRSFHLVSQRHLKFNISKTELIIYNPGPLGYSLFWLMSSPSTRLPRPGSHL